MCLIAKMNWFRKLFNMKPKVRIAKDDIKVYKLLSKEYNFSTHCYDLCSYFFNSFKWVLGNTEKSTLVFKYDSILERNKNNEYVNRKTWVVEQGLHAYIDFFKCRGTFHILADKCLYEAIIPKGSHYVIGEDYTIVSDQLIIIGKYEV